MIVVIYATHEGFFEVFGPFETYEAARSFARNEAERMLPTYSDAAIVGNYTTHGGAAIRSTKPDETTFADWQVSTVRRP